MKPLAIAAFFDGRAGHEKQTRGILLELGKLAPVEVLSVTVSRQGLGGRLWDVLSLFSGREASLPAAARFEQQADLVIGTGSSLHAPMLLFKKMQSRRGLTAPRLVTCMTPSFPFSSRDFDLCFVPLHDLTTATAHVFETVGAPCAAAPSGEHLTDKGLILVGGIDAKSHTWSTERLLAQVAKVVARSPKEMQWTVTSSPRTPAATTEELERFAGGQAKVAFFPFDRTGPGWLEKRYAESGTAWVTADSVSMVYEALSAGCAVGVLPVNWLKKNNKFQRGLDQLFERGLATDYDSWRTGFTMLRPPAAPLNEAHRCAMEILSRWWPERLP